MLSPEAFARRRKEVLKSASGLGLPSIARRRVAEPNHKDTLDTAVHWTEGDRRYKLTQNGQAVTIEGHVTPQGLRGRTEAMLPLEIQENGVICSHRERVSPHDPRLALTAGDLHTGERITHLVYQQTASELEPY